MESDLHHDHQAAASENHPSDGEEQGASHVTSRSFECNFCRRGFSNAQALGGHMNIHRKDKAKLKQQQSSNQIQQDQAKSYGEDSNKQKWNWNVSLQEHAIHKRQQLPLFAESPTSSETQKPQQGQTQTTTEQASLSTQDSSSELDLELRLGPEPQDSSAAETGTRNFFLN
ncbi:hypothetical protein AAZX31_11G132300 [Glycine max]